MDDRWGEGLLFVAASVVIVFAGMFLFSVTFSSKLVREYYVAGQSVSSVAGIRADIPWDQDYKVYCSSDIDKVISVVHRLNKELKYARHKGN